LPTSTPSSTCPTGSSWALTIFTVDEIRRLLRVWRETGEAAHGSYFWTADHLIVPEPGIPTMAAAIRELVCAGDLSRVGICCVAEPPPAGGR
jgi:hypothetical protein